MKYQRGDICYYDFGTQTSSIQGGYRPCVIVGNNYQNDSSSICVVAPITTALKTKLPTHISLPMNNKSKINGTILCEQLTTVNQLNLKKTGESLGDEILQKVNKALAIELDLDFNHIKEKQEFVEAFSYMKKTIANQHRKINTLISLLRESNQKLDHETKEKQKVNKLIKSIK